MAATTIIVPIIRSSIRGHVFSDGLSNALHCHDLMVSKRFEVDDDTLLLSVGFLSSSNSSYSSKDLLRTFIK